MRSLSIKQPWASLIAHNIKNIENRTWKTNFRGRIFIHASAKNAGALYELLNEKQIEAISNHWTAAPPFPDRPVSAIIGEVDIIDCVINHESIWAEKTILKPNKYDKKYWSYNSVDKSGFNQKLYNKDLVAYENSKTIYNWVLANPILYDKPITNVKGKLSFWEPDIEIKECIGCNQKFNLELMVEDSAEEKYCEDCADEMFPEMQKEYKEMVAKGEIEANE